jgi:hypothetical protein
MSNQILEFSINSYNNFSSSDEEQKQSVSNISSLLSEKVMTFQEVLVEMGPNLTSHDEKIRGRVTLLLAEITKTLSLSHPIQISANSIYHITIFFLKRMEDFPSLLPSLKGIEVCIAYHTSRMESKETYIKDIFKSLSDVNCQNLSQSYRSQIYKIYLTLLDNSIARECLGGHDQVKDGGQEMLGHSAVGKSSTDTENISLQFIESVLTATGGRNFIF